MVTPLAPPSPARLAPAPAAGRPLPLPPEVAAPPVAAQTVGPVGSSLREQLWPLGAQLGAGLGNLLFTLVALRVLSPPAYADLAVFLAAYVLLHVPAGALAAGSALDPSVESELRGRALRLGAGVGVALGALTPVLSGVLDMPPLLLLLLAAAAPGAALLPLARGRLYGERRSGLVVGSLLAEPLARLTLGIALAVVAGPTAAAAAVVLAGYCALGVAYARRPAGALGWAVRPPQRRAAGGGVSASLVGAFLLVAVVQSQDLLLAKAVLDTTQAAAFAVLSTVGGAAAFAVMTVPLVLLPRAAERDREALREALVVAGGVGVLPAVCAAVMPVDLLVAVLGPTYLAVAGVAPAYLLAMGLLGTARVLVAAQCAAGRGRPVVLLVALAAAGQSLAVLLVARDAASVALVTLLTAVLLLAALGVQRLVTDPGLPALAAAVRSAGHRLLAPLPLAVLGLTATALVVRLSTNRGLWLDEATSWYQAQLPFAVMVEDLATTDVHPPLWGAVLWAWVRLFGDGETALRMPSMLFGAALVPALYVAGRDLFGRRTGLVAAVLGTVAPLAVWYGQEARMYSLFMLLATLAVWLQVRAVRTGRPRDWAGFTLACAGLLWTQWFAFLPVTVHVLALAVVLRRSGDPGRDRSQRRRALLSVAGIAGLVLPLLPYLQHQLAAYAERGVGLSLPSQVGAEVTGTGGAALELYAPLVNLTWALLGYHGVWEMSLLVAAWPLGLLLALLLLGRGRSFAGALLLTLALVPPLALLAVGLSRPDLFELRYFIGIVPVLLLLTAHGVSSWSRGTAPVALVTGLVATVLAVALLDQQLGTESPRRYDFRAAVSLIQAEAEPGDRLVFAPEYVDDVLRYYDPAVPAAPLTGGSSPRPSGGSLFLLASFRDKPEVERVVQQNLDRLSTEAQLVAHHQFANVDVWEFAP